VSELEMQTKWDDLKALTKSEKKIYQKDLYLTEYEANTCREHFSAVTEAKKEDLSSRSMTDAMQEEEDLS
jgi:hypothetical protein